MTHLRLVPTFAAAAVLAFITLSPSLSHAQSSCADDSECDQGFECTIVGASGCASGAAAPAPACPPGETCPTPEPQPDPCETTVIKACTPAHCTSDAQCADGMVCHAYEAPCAVTNCACPSDQPDCGCGVAACDPQTVSMCTPRYALPCTQAADCGEGFRCEQQQVDCTCAGGAEGRPSEPPMPGDAAPGAPLPPEGSGAAGGFAPPDTDPVPDPICTCPESSVLACVPNEIECANASECPAGWTCQAEVQATDPGCAGPDCPEAKPAAPVPTRSLCRPEYYGSVGVDSNGSGPGTPTKGGTGTANPEAASTDDADANESAACQMGRAPASSGALSLLVLFGALLGLKRRRA